MLNHPLVLDGKPDQFDIPAGESIHEEVVWGKSLYDPTTKLSDEQKRALAELNRKPIDVKLMQSNPKVANKMMLDQLEEMKKIANT